jgi:hypothetical protein
MDFIIHAYLSQFQCQRSCSDVRATVLGTPQSVAKRRRKSKHVYFCGFVVSVSANLVVALLKTLISIFWLLKGQSITAQSPLFVRFSKGSTECVDFHMRLPLHVYEYVTQTDEGSEFVFRGSFAISFQQPTCILPITAKIFILFETLWKF